MYHKIFVPVFAIRAFFLKPRVKEKFFIGTYGLAAWDTPNGKGLANFVATQ